MLLNNYTCWRYVMKKNQKRSLNQMSKRVVGYSEKRPLNILIDPGSTHNFIDEEVAKQLELEVLMVRPQSINVADGGNRQTTKMCKGLPWMMQGTMFVDNFLLLPFEIL
ncbi:hypothetical protein KY289_013686 [Solanum tuberosum]|nr:hypothetical protein KY289_013686 [Solanum tuberosum]